MEFTTISGTEISVSRIGLGTWAVGGKMWGGSDEADSIRTIQAAAEHGINLIDTAPVYGFGLSEELVGKALAQSRNREKVVIASKVGIEWRNGTLARNASRERILREVDDSLRRLQTSYIDIYQVHWPDPQVATEETAKTMLDLFNQARFARSASAIFPHSKWNVFVRSHRCILRSRLTTCSSGRSTGTCCLISEKIKSTRSFTGLFAVDC